MTTLRLSSFAVVSGAGWCLDFAVFNYLVAEGGSLLMSNVLSASLAVTLVFLTSRKWIFRNHHGSVYVAAGEYVLWNAVAITGASYLLKLVAALLMTWNLDSIQQVMYWTIGDQIDKSLLVPNLAKVLVTPFSMYANFVAMGYIVERRLSFL